MKKQVLTFTLLLSLFVFNMPILFAQVPFITRWVASDGTINIPTNEAIGIFNYELTWTNMNGAGNGSASNITGDYVISGLPAGDTIEVEISGSFPNIFCQEIDDISLEYDSGPIDGADELVEIVQWGDIHWLTFYAAFSGCDNMVLTATDTPDLSGVQTMMTAFRECRALTTNPAMNSWDVSNVSDMYGLFEFAENFNQDIGNWNVGNVTTMNNMFSSCDLFNQDIGSWDVSNVTDMSYMFNSTVDFNKDIGSWNVSNVTNMTAMFWHAIAFDQYIGSWNVGNVTDMSFMFYETRNFNQYIGSWNVSNVTNMASMFGDAEPFNQNISGWDVSQVTNMQEMFTHTDVFNQDISGWNVSNVTDMTSMFEDAEAFNQNLGNWNLSSLIVDETYYGTTYQNTAEHMFDQSAMSTENYDLTLEGWRNNFNTPDNIDLGSAGLTYCTSQEERDFLINNKGWTITDDTNFCEVPANDVPCSPIALSCNNPVTGNTTVATQSLTNATGCSGDIASAPNKDVWFTFTANGFDSYALVGTGFDGVIMVYTGDCANPDELYLIDCEDEIGGAKDSLYLGALGAGEYLVQYFSYYPYQAGYYDMELFCIPGNDYACEAIFLTCNNTESGSTLNATQSASISTGCGFSTPNPNKDVWFEFTADGSSSYALKATGFDGVIMVYTGYCGNLTALVQIACQDEIGGNSDSLNLGVLDANTYLVQYFSFFPSDASSFTMELNCNTPINDDACNATELYCNEVVTGNTINASQYLPSAVGCGFTTSSPNKDVWFEFSADGSSSYSLVGNGFDGVIVVYTGDCSNPDALTSIDCVDEVGGDTDSLGLGVLDADTYLVQYFPYSSYFAGEFTMTLHCIPANDDPCNATVLACGVPVAGNNSGATQTLAGTTGCGYPTFAPNKDVWFSFVADGLSDYTLTGNGFDGIIKVYSGEDCTLLTSVPGSGYCVDELGGTSDQLTLTTPAAGTYYVQYFSYSSYVAGAFTMELNCTLPVCESPTLSVSTIGMSGAPLACVPLNGEYYLSIGIIGGAGNSTYTLTDGGSSTITIAESDAFYTFGPYPAGSSQTITATGNDDATCSVSASVNLEVCPPIYDCPALSANIGDACNDGNSNTINDVVTADCACVGTVIYDCPALSANIGDACNDGNSNTVNDVVTADCACVGTVIYDCPALSANIGDPCDDGDANTTGDLVNAACECVGTPTDALLNGSIDWAAACGSRSGTVSLFTPGTATVVASYPITVQADGSFSVSGLSAGTYDIIVQVDGFLTTGFEDLSVASGANSLTVGTLVNGDLNTDNAVTLLDFSITNAAYGSLIGDSNYNPLADVDCSGSINLLDISVINAAYGQTGVSAPL